jgi:MFS family permease
MPDTDNKADIGLISGNGTDEQPSGRIQKVKWHKKTFAALRSRNYKLWFWGQMISLFGSWMQITAQGFLIYELTHSPVFLGYVGFASGIPTWLFMIYGGVIADRIPRRTILIATQSLMMILAFILAFLTFTGLVQPWHLILLAFLLGTANAFDAPARQAFVLELVHREDLTNAIALNSMMFNSATAAGPALAGITYAAFGPSWCFLVNGISYIGVLLALVAMKLKNREIKKDESSAFSAMGSGLKYIFSNRLITVMMLLAAASSIFGISFGTLFPAWAVNVLHGGASTNGLLQSARGLGALFSSFFIASLGRINYKGRLLTTGVMLFPVFIIIFALVSWLPLSLIVLVLAGFVSILFFNMTNALLQITVKDEFRGRVMGVYTATFFGFMPLGSLLIGAAAEKYSEQIAIISFSAILIIISVSVNIFYPALRRQK